MSIYEHADLVLGFNSTCLVEAHLASCHAASIELYDFESADISNYLLPLPDSISRITTTDQLYQLLVCFIQGTLKPFSVDKNYVAQWLGNSNFDSGKRCSSHLSIYFILNFHFIYPIIPVCTVILFCFGSHFISEYLAYWIFVSFVLQYATYF